MNLEELLVDYGEIEFIYQNNHFVIGRFSNKTIIKSKKIVYWLMTDNEEQVQRFYDINSVLNSKIDGKYIYEILDEIEIIY